MVLPEEPSHSTFADSLCHQQQEGYLVYFVFLGDFVFQQSRLCLQEPETLFWVLVEQDNEVLKHLFLFRPLLDAEQLFFQLVLVVVL